ncbi:G protein-coupled receptor 137Ba [Hyalella azteca]|uniref:G protein-coupled receptor 137Ba n=1 Tax=Hyalella azteca TaxID=294128 RepID=A0A8B7NZ99_HYAAZ|nr:G protein-coupled receptor 137Ba [Hyalella azteca]
MAGQSLAALSYALDTNTEDNLLAIRRPLTYVSLCLYGLLFTYIYAQLWMVMHYSYKRWCYRTYVLYASIAWCILRITLFSYYAMLEHEESKSLGGNSEPRVLSRRVGFLSYFLLYSLPLYLQFTCLCLMVAYFYQIHRSSHQNFHPREMNEWWWPSYVLLALNIFVLCLNFGSSAVIKWQEDSEQQPSPAGLPLLTVYVVHLRVLLNGAAFMLVASALAYVTVKVANTAEARLLLETENLTQFGAVLVCVLLVFLFLCRTVINVLALVPTVNFVLDTDQVDLLSDSRSAYFMLVTVLFLWEFVPTLLMVIFFRVKAPSQQQSPAWGQGTNGAPLLSETLSDPSSDDDLSHNFSFLHAASAPRNFSPPLPASSHNSASLDDITGSSSAETEEPGNIHPLSTRFCHRTSLFSYRILNRANVRPDYM